MPQSHNFKTVAMTSFAETAIISKGGSFPKPIDIWGPRHRSKNILLLCSTAL